MTFQNIYTSLCFALTPLTRVLFELVIRFLFLFSFLVINICWFYRGELIIEQVYSLYWFFKIMRCTCMRIGASPAATEGGKYFAFDNPEVVICVFFIRKFHVACVLDMRTRLSVYGFYDYTIDAQYICKWIGVWCRTLFLFADDSGWSFLHK